MKKNVLEISAMHGLRIGELQELQRRLDSFLLTPELLEKKAMYDDDEESGSSYHDYSIINGTAVYKIAGPLITSSTFFSRWLGYTSYDDVRNNLIHAAQNPEVQDILLFVTSPGGSAFGVTDGAEAIRKVSATKPVYAFTNANMASGAYWLSSQAKKIFVAPEAEAGSIGVIVTHASYQKQLEDDGVKITVIKSSELKAVGGPYKDLSEKEVQHIQDQIDQLDTLFKESVQAARPGIKLSAMNGATYIGAEAVKVGLADAVMSYDETMQYIASQRKTTNLGGLYMKKEEIKVALEAGKTLDEIGLSQEEVDKILSEDSTSDKEIQEQVDAGKEIEVPAGTEVGVEAAVLVELNTKIADLTLEASKKDEKIASLEAQVASFEANAEELKGIVAQVTANRRTALGFQSTVDLSQFTTASLLAEYRAVSEQFDKLFITGGILKNKHVDTAEPEVKVVQRSSLDIGRLKGADITRKNS